MRLTIGEIATRTGVATSALRFYESEGLITSDRSDGNQRRYQRAVIRRVSIILVAKNLGMPLDSIRQALESVPISGAPTQADWLAMSETWRDEMTRRIEVLSALRDKLDSCIGCGCLSLERCGLYNPLDKASALGAGPRYLMGDSDESI